ncbi:MAG: type II toxin-antitoxin system prevent-host-death family antitoxin [Rhizomicrobium sp.]
MNLRDANQQFSKLVREVEETGETITILRNGEPAAEIRRPPSRTTERKLSPAQKAALKSMFEIAHRVRGKSTGRKLTRDEMHER